YRCNITYRSFHQTYSLYNESKKQKNLNELSTLFVTARECLEDARESVDTVYFAPDLKDAEKAVQECLDFYEKLLKEMDEENANKLKREQQSKMEQLKAELRELGGGEQ